MTKPLRLVQLTDLHLMADSDALYRGVDSRSHFLAALQQALSLEPELLLLTGDLAEQVQPETYAWLYQQLQATGLAWQWLPGNHDSVELMQSFKPAHFELSLAGWQLLSLNTSLPGEAAGWLAASELERLSQALAAQRPTLIALHHHPLPVGSAWMDALGLKNAAALWEVLQAADQPRVLLCGHVHQAASWQHLGASVYATPATSVQFRPQVEQFQLATQAQPGLRWLDIQPSGHWQTQLVHFSVEFTHRRRGQGCG